MNDLAFWRRRYARMGFATIPLRPRSKRPLRKGWLTRAGQWAGAPSDANLGILTGDASAGLVVMDFDTKDGPERVLGMKPQQLAVLTIVVETARGWHVYTRQLGRGCSTPMEGLDVRGQGGMVVAPPSIHPSGSVYRMLGNARGLVSLSALWVEPGGPSPMGADLIGIEEWMRLQHPKLKAAWEQLKAPPSVSFDASRADFAVARCLRERGDPPESVADILQRLPGSRAAVRGREYALTTARRAFP